MKKMHMVMFHRKSLLTAAALAAMVAGRTLLLTITNLMVIAKMALIHTPRAKEVAKAVNAVVAKESTDTSVFRSQTLCKQSLATCCRFALMQADLTSCFTKMACTLTIK
jgi:hypothetical protein